VFLLLGLILAVVLFAMWELRGGPRWRASVGLLACAVVALGFMSLKAL
jgi:hypothetical protein